MSADAGNRQISEAMLSEAAQWYLAIREGDCSLQDPDFNAWLVADPGHEAAFAQMQQAWSSLEGATLVPPHAREQGSQRWPLWSGMLASVLLVSALAFGFFMHDTADMEPVQFHQTRVGELATVQLLDGSRVVLDQASLIRVGFSPERRLIELLQGQARFEVAHDARPFDVLVRQTLVRATGTVFNIELLGADTTVSLLEGGVSVIHGSDDSLESVHDKQSLLDALLGDASIWRVDLVPREQLLVSAEAQYEHKRNINVARIDAWQQQQLIFEDELLSSAVRRINRYAAETILLAEDESMASLRISGVFANADAQGFAEAISDYLALQLHELPSGDLLLSPASL